MTSIGLHALELVSLVAAKRSFRAAARELDPPPSSVSHTVASLEQHLGVRLFLRSTRSVSLTEAGEAFLARVRPALAGINEAIAGAQDFRDQPAGLIRLNASAWGAEWLLPVVVDFMASHDEVRVDLVVEGRLVDIIADGCDAGLRQLSLIPQDMVALPLGVRDAMILVASPSYLAKRGTPETPGDLLHHACIRSRLPSGAVIRWEVGHSASQLAEVAVTGPLVIGTTVLAAKAAERGAGIAYVVEREVLPALAAGTLVQVLAPWPPPLEGEALYYPKQRLPSAAFRAFIEFFKSRLPLQPQPGSRTPEISAHRPSNFSCSAAS